ncbi:MAG: hypothetical protein R2854_22940 [Caldilineaceae bacterium]
MVNLNGVERSLDTAGAQQVPVDLTPIERFLNFISDPTIASLLLSLGILGLIIEIRTPGIGVPGVVGAISLLLAFYALGQLDANFVGIALIGLAAALFVAEAFTPTFGILAVGGIAAFIFGAFLLFNETGYPVPWPAIIALAVVMGAVTIWIGAAGHGRAAQARPHRQRSAHRPDCARREAFLCRRDRPVRGGRELERQARPGRSRGRRPGSHHRPRRLHACRAQRKRAIKQLPITDQQ